MAAGVQRPKLRAAMCRKFVDVNVIWRKSWRCYTGYRMVLIQWFWLRQRKPVNDVGLNSDDPGSSVYSSSFLTTLSLIFFNPVWAWLHPADPRRFRRPTASSSSSCCCRAPMAAGREALIIAGSFFFISSAWYIVSSIAGCALADPVFIRCACSFGCLMFDSFTYMTASRALSITLKNQLVSLNISKSVPAPARAGAHRAGARYVPASVFRATASGAMPEMKPIEPRRVCRCMYNSIVAVCQFNHRLCLLVLLQQQRTVEEEEEVMDAAPVDEVGRIFCPNLPAFDGSGRAELITDSGSAENIVYWRMSTSARLCRQMDTGGGAPT